MGPDSVKRLDIWKESTALVVVTYRLTQNWPKQEMYGLTAQVRRAAVSIPANLAEGIGRGTPGEACRFAQVALGSLYELDTLLYLASELGFAEADAVKILRGRLSTLGRQISSFIRYKEGRR